MTSKNGADFVHFVMQALAPASQNGQSRAKDNGPTKKRGSGVEFDPRFPFYFVVCFLLRPISTKPESAGDSHYARFHGYFITVLLSLRIRESKLVHTLRIL
jgi:hypothetical protein